MYNEFISAIASDTVMSKEEVHKFLESKLNFHFVTIHEMGNIKINPLVLLWQKHQKALDYGSKCKEGPKYLEEVKPVLVSMIRTFHTKDIKMQRFGNYNEDP